MKSFSNGLACQVLFLQAADEGRGPVLFGEDADRICERVLPFVEDVSFPSLYLEFPLKGEPFLDVTALYSSVPEHFRFSHPSAAGTERMLDWYTGIQEKYNNICFGFELDAGKPEDSLAAVHFQPRRHTELAGVFCDLMGEAEAGSRYMEKASRMPEGWPLAFFGLFRGRPGSPLRVCGYMDRMEKERCAEDPAHLEAAFRQIGFTAFDGTMLSQVSALLAAVPGNVDFQFDLLPDGTIGETFAIDASFAIRQSMETLTAFREGDAARLMHLLEDWQIADDRWKAAPGMAFTRGIPIQDEEGKPGCFALVLTLNWLKVRWRNGALQPAKLYALGKTQTL
ncbi:MAG: hypothetical protein J6U01_12560 [Clostridia bacterium]|nr:hypothetical protein [Clostridia bacterium]